MVLKVQGTVELEVVVKADGTVGDARVVRGLDARLPDLVAELKRTGGAHADAVLQIVGNGPIGLDANALECVRTWTFVPGTILGKAASVIRTESVPFKLR
jgi:outer membrane biosynthesis protein TonB